MLTKQEMFNRAWTGLKAQGFTRAWTAETGCVYAAPDGRRCAWGHVDLSLTAEDEDDTSIPNLRAAGIGLAAELDGPGLTFALVLQDAHDVAYVPGHMETRLRALAGHYGLTIPG